MRDWGVSAHLSELSFNRPAPFDAVSGRGERIPLHGHSRDWKTHLNYLKLFARNVHVHV